MIHKIQPKVLQFKFGLELLEGLDDMTFSVFEQRATTLMMAMSLHPTRKLQHVRD
jgi:hypothetical protein